MLETRSNKGDFKDCSFVSKSVFDRSGSLGTRLWARKYKTTVSRTEPGVSSQHEAAPRLMRSRRPAGSGPRCRAGAAGSDPHHGTLWFGCGAFRRDETRWKRPKRRPCWHHPYSAVTSKRGAIQPEKVSHEGVSFKPGP
ncbi:hypothetical protein VTK26DRAFT_6022 [Humicola hyalothermophila]